MFFRLFVWLCHYLFKILSSKNYSRNESFFKTGQTFWVEPQLTTDYIRYVDHEIEDPDLPSDTIIGIPRLHTDKQCPADFFAMEHLRTTVSPRLVWVVAGLVGWDGVRCGAVGGWD